MAVRGAALVREEQDQARDRRQVARRLLGELGAYRSQLLATGVWTILGAVAQSASPWLIGRVIDGPIRQRDLTGLFWYAVVLVVIALIGALATQMQVTRIGIIGQTILKTFRQRLFDHFQRLPLRFYGRQPIGDLVSRVSSDVDTINQFVSQGLSQTVGQTVGLFVTMIAMLALDWQMALVSFAIIPVLLGATVLVSRRARIAYRVTRKTTGAVTASLQEEIGGIRETQAFNRGGYNSRRFDEENRANYTAFVRAVRISSALPPVVDVLSTIATGIVLAVGGWQVYHGSLEIGVLASFLLYVQTFFRPIQLLSQMYTQAQSSLAGAERIYGILDQPAEQPDPPTAVDVTDVRGDIRFEHVTFAYDTGRPILHDISIEIPAGQSVAIVGPTGAGKTTLVNLIPRFYELAPGSGRITLDGEDIAAIHKDGLRAQIALVLAGAVPVRRDGPRQSGLWPSDRDRGRGAGGGRGGPGRHVHPRPAAGLRDGAGRGWWGSERGTAATAGLCPRRAGRSAHPDPG